MSLHAASSGVSLVERRGIKPQVRIKRAPPEPRAKTIVFFEPRCRGITHVDSAASIIDMFYKIFPEYRLLFYTEKRHGDFTKQYFPTRFEQINIHPPRDTRNRWQWFREVFWDFIMMQKIGMKKPEYIVCMGYTWEIVLFAKLFQRKQKIVFFFHSMEEEIKQNIPAYKPVWWFWRSLEWEISFHVQIVFGESIRREIAKIRPKLGFKSIDLPRLPRYDCTAPINKVTVTPLKFSSISSANVGRDVSAIFLLEEKLGQMTEDFELHSRGTVDCNGSVGGVKIPDGSKVKFSTKHGGLSAEELDAYINMMDFCLFFTHPILIHLPQAVRCSKPWRI